MSPAGKAPAARTVTDRLFGRKTGQHSHPATHPAWMSFPDGKCPVCPPAPPLSLTDQITAALKGI